MTTIGCASPARASLYWQSLLPRVGAFSAHCGNSKILRPGQKQCLTWSFDCGAKGTRTPDPHTASVVRYQLRHSPVCGYRVPVTGASPSRRALAKLHHRSDGNQIPRAGRNHVRCQELFAPVMSVSQLGLDVSTGLPSCRTAGVPV